VSRAMTRSEGLADMLSHCTEAIIRHLDAAFARVWTLNEADNVLELQASAGMYTHINGPHARVPVGQFKIGLIAQERQPHFTNAVMTDPRVGDKEWARREGMVSFAGYPLTVGDCLFGVIAMFARHPLSEFVLQALATIATNIAFGLERLQARETLRESELRFRQLAQHIHEVFYLFEVEGHQMFYISPAYEQIWGFRRRRCISSLPTLSKPCTPMTGHACMACSTSIRVVNRASLSTASCGRTVRCGGFWTARFPFETIHGTAIGLPALRKIAQSASRPKRRCAR
jgi:two-component system, NtrC family, sensor kinase